MSKQQRIVCAAIRFGPHIVCGARHYDMIMHQIIPELPHIERIPGEQGFIDNNGVFHNCVAAFRIATEAQQIRHKSGNLNSNELFSEDLY